MDVYFNPNDDFKTLADGSVAWTHSDEEGKLTLHILGV